MSAARRRVATRRCLATAALSLACLPATFAAAQEAPDLPEWHRAHARDLPPDVFRHGPSQAPVSPAPTIDVAALARESFVIEQAREQVRFERDGTGRVERLVRVRVQDDDGVRQWGQLVVPYNATNERLDLVEVTVRKADGSTVTAGPDAMQDLSLPVQQQAPAYSDYRERHIAVPSLRPGDVLTFRVVRVIAQPLVPGHFWYEQDATRYAIILDEQFWLDLPADRDVTIKVRTGIEDVSREHASEAEPGRRLRVWRTANLTRPDGKAEAEAARKRRADGDVSPFERPAFQLTTFKTWDDVARWYATLATPMAEPDAAVKAKAEALTRGKTTPAEKLEALYEFVSREVRYVSLSFGGGRLQPHAAAEVLRNQYGDCKDKHTLLASLARAAGLRVDPVLIGTMRTLDPDVPSPAQFDHVMSVVRDASIVTNSADRDQWIWLDTTPGVAPYRMLLPILRGKTALLVTASAPAAPAAATSAPSAAAVSAVVPRSPFLVDIPKQSAVLRDTRSAITGTISDAGLDSLHEPLSLSFRMERDNCIDRDKPECPARRRQGRAGSRSSCRAPCGPWTDRLAGPAREPGPLI
jgi:transglutaminase-like putative cysteine protease